MGMFCRIFTNLTWYLGSETAEIKTLHEHQIMGKMYENVIFETMEFGGPLFWDKPVRRRNIDKIPAILAEWCNSSTGNKGCLWSFSQKKNYWRLWWTLATAAFLCTVLTAPATFSRVFFCFAKQLCLEPMFQKCYGLKVCKMLGKNNKRLWPWAFLGTKKNAGFHLPHLDRFTSTNIN